MSQLLYAWENGKEVVPIVQVGHWGWSTQVWKILTPTGFKPWAVQPILSNYTDYAVPTSNRNNTEH